MREIIESDQMRILRRDDKALLVFRRPLNRWRRRIEQAAATAHEARLPGALLAVQDQHGIRPALAKRGDQPGDDKDKIIVAGDVREGAKHVDRGSAERRT